MRVGNDGEPPTLEHEPPRLPPRAGDDPHRGWQRDDTWTDRAGAGPISTAGSQLPPEGPARPRASLHSMPQTACHACKALTSPVPVARSGPLTAVSFELVVPPSMSLAVSVRAARISCGLSAGFFCSSSAAMPHTCGVAKEVP